MALCLTGFPKTSRKGYFKGNNRLRILSPMYFYGDKKKSLLCLRLCGIIDIGHRGDLKKLQELDV
jgi:hypothetical protein